MRWLSLDGDRAVHRRAVDAAVISERPGGGEGPGDGAAGVERLAERRATVKGDGVSDGPPVRPRDRLANVHGQGGGRERQGIRCGDSGWAGPTAGWAGPGRGRRRAALARGATRCPAGPAGAREEPT